MKTICMHHSPVTPLKGRPGCGLQPASIGIVAASSFLLLAGAPAADWPQWGGSDTRNMASGEKDLPESFDPGKKKAGGSEVDLSTTRDVRWVAKLGTETYGNPTVSGGRVFVGTNNGAPRDPRLQGDRGIVMCFEEATGRFLWQLAVAKVRPEGNFNGDFKGLGVCSSPTVDGDRVYVVTSRCEVLSLDAGGQADGNDGPFLDEGRYMAPQSIRKPGKPPSGRKPDEADKAPDPVEVTAADGDIIWRYDLMTEIDVWPQDATDCSVLIHGDLAYVCTSNGVDTSHTNIPSPQAPSLIALDKGTGKLVAADDAGIGPRILHGQWSSPSSAEVGGRTLIFFGAGDGYCYAFDAEPSPASGSGPGVLKTVWRCDCNPPEYRARDGKPLPYNKRGEGPSEVIGTPVFHEGRVYVTIGQDTRHGPGKGALTCIDARLTGDISSTGRLWTYTGLNRSFATPSVSEGLVFVTDFPGKVHCLDAATGRCLWVHETGAFMMGSTFVADGRVYSGNEGGELTILAAAKKLEVLARVDLKAPIHCTPIAANGVLYVACHRQLYAVRKTPDPR